MLAAACCLAVAVAQPPAGKADPASVLSRIAGLKPAPADPNDAPVRKLRKERYNARLEAAQTLAKTVKAGVSAPNELTGLVMVLAENAADLEQDPAGRVKWLQLRVDLLKDEERLARDRVKAGGSFPGEAALATAARADAEIDLLLYQEFLKSGPPPGKK
ncbi:MAG: hypothetical protein K2X87_05735 [Gemmataceae bacterium]|nr:hypothetical protein [Gemmataceae bacterium]